MAEHYRFRQGQALQLSAISQTAVVVRAWVRLRYDDGADVFMTIPERTITGDRVENTIVADDIATQDGYVVSGNVEMLTAGIQRGETYVRLGFAPFGCVIAEGYVDTLSELCIGTHKGSHEGPGWTHVVTITALATGPAANVNYLLGISNLLRKLISFEHNYGASSDVQTRTIGCRMFNLLGERTGVASTVSQTHYQLTDLVLTGDQDGVMGWDEKRGWVNDNGTLVIEDGSANPSPFPMWVPDDIDANAQIAVSNSNANVNDESSTYLLVEEWLNL